MYKFSALCGAVARHEYWRLKLDVMDFHGVSIPIPVLADSFSAQYTLIVRSRDDRRRPGGPHQLWATGRLQAAVIVIVYASSVLT